MHTNKVFWKYQVIRKLEYVRGICRYPNQILGRRNFPYKTDNKGGILVIAAHPDDDVIGLGITLNRYIQYGNNVTVVFTTNGAGGVWKSPIKNQRSLSETRYNEACEALKLIKIPKEQIISFGFPDGGLFRYILQLAIDLLTLIHTIEPKEIYVHALEGGHPDHDITSFVTQYICHQIDFSEVFEWGEYNGETSIEDPSTPLKFPLDPFLGETKQWINTLNDTEIRLKEKMLEKHESQQDLIKSALRNQEIVRKAKPINLKARLQYFSQLDSDKINPLIDEFLFTQNRIPFKSIRSVSG